MEICKRCKLAEECGVSSESDFCLNYEPRPLSNADRINAMSVEEKAEWLSQFDCSADCKARRGACGYGNNCYKAWLEWLKKEADYGIL